MMNSPTSDGAQTQLEAEKHDVVPKEAEGFVAVLSLGLALFLISIAPFVTRTQPPDRAWFLAPMNGSVFALVVMAVPAACMSYRWLKELKSAESSSSYFSRSYWAFGDFRSAIEYGVYFCVYLWIIHYIGFALSTLLFGQACLYRSGLTSSRWAAANVIFTVIIVLLLRVFLGLWFPMSPLFKLLPPSLGNVLGAYL